MLNLPKIVLKYHTKPSLTNQLNIIPIAFKCWINLKKVHRIENNYFKVFFLKFKLIFIIITLLIEPLVSPIYKDSIDKIE